MLILKLVSKGEEKNTSYLECYEDTPLSISTWDREELVMDSYSYRDMTQGLDSAKSYLIFGTKDEYQDGIMFDGDIFVMKDGKTIDSYKSL